MNTKDMISKLAEMALSQGLGREVHVTFCQLGKGRDYSKGTNVSDSECHSTARFRENAKVP